nr:hypothetical protein [Oscillospiraceae bacterium]
NSRALARGLLQETNTSTMAELMQLYTDTLKDAAQRLWMNMCAPTCDGTLIPADVYRAYRDGAASGIEFVVGIINGEMQALRSSFGSKNYEDALNAAVDMLQNGMDDSVAEEVQTYLRAQTASSSELEARSKLMEQWIALGIYRIATTLAQGGNKVHLMLWDEKALIEKLGSGTADVLATLLGNGEALQMYGSVMNEDVSAILQALLEKFVSGDALQLYRNEIKGIDSFDWKAFPQALIVADGEITCAAIEDRITEVKGLVDYTVR